MLKAGDIAIVSGARTPFGRYCGKLKDFTAQELGAVAAKGAIERSGIDPKEFDHVVFGNAQQTSGRNSFSGSCSTEACLHNSIHSSCCSLIGSLLRMQQKRARAIEALGFLDLAGPWHLS